MIYYVTMLLLLYSDHYITAVHWRDNGNLLVGWSNRYQNHTVVTLCHVVTRDCHLVGIANLFSLNTKLTS